MQLNTASPARGAITLRSIARLKDGLSIERAQVLASALAGQLEAKYPESNEKVGFLPHTAACNASSATSDRACSR